jgi:Cu-Zn family superoxide dismutase
MSRVASVASPAAIAAFVALAAAVLVPSRPAGADSHREGGMKTQKGAKKAVATLSVPPGSTVTGKVTLTPAGPGAVRVVAEVSGATPGPHGFHLHETGSCVPPDFASAGGHFNPTAAPHAGPDSTAHHAGDLGNLMVGADGRGRLDWISHDLELGSGPKSAIGKAVVFHAAADDFTTQPTGNAGGRLACGVIEVAP